MTSSSPPPVASIHTTAVSAFWVTIDNAAQAAIAVGTLILTARLLAPLEFAVAAVSLSLVQIFTPLAGGFFNDAILQRQRLDEQHLASAWVSAVTIGIVLWLIFWLLADPLANFVGLPKVALLLPWMSLPLIGEAVASVPAAFARRHGHFRILAVRTVIGRLSGAAFGVGAALLGSGAWCVVVQQLTSTLIGAVLVLIGAKLRFQPRLFSISHLRDLSGFAFASLSDILIWPAQAKIATPVMSAVLGPAVAAYWNVAFRIVDMLYLQMVSGLNHLTIPLFARSQGDGPAVREGFAMGTTLTSLLVLPIFVGLAVAAPEFVRVFLGSAWMPASGLVAILSIASCLMFIRHFVYVALAATGRPGGNMHIAAQGFAAGLVGMLAGAPFGLVASAIGFTLRILPHYFLGARLMRQATGLGLRAQLVPAVRPLIAVIAMAVVMMTVRHFLQAAQLDPVQMLAGGVASGVITYALAVTLVARRPAMIILAGIGISSSTAIPAHDATE